VEIGLFQATINQLSNNGRQKNCEMMTLQPHVLCQHYSIGTTIA
jgi:hypothetical protein